LYVYGSNSDMIIDFSYHHSHEQFFPSGKILLTNYNV
jgi:hypothetical protein